MKLFLTTPHFVGYDNSLDAWVPEVWAQETLAILEEQMVIGNLCHRDFNDEISEFGNTVNTRRPNEYIAKRKGVNDDVTVQASSATNIAVVLNQHIHTSFTIKDKEQTLSFQDLIRVYLNPAALSIAQKIDRILMGQVYQYFVNRDQQDRWPVGRSQHRQRQAPNLGTWPVVRREQSASDESLRDYLAGYQGRHPRTRPLHRCRHCR